MKVFGSIICQVYCSQKLHETGVLLTTTEDVFLSTGDEYTINAVQPIEVFADENIINSQAYLQVLTEVRAMVVHAGLSDYYNNVTSSTWGCSDTGFMNDCPEFWAPMYYSKLTF